MKISSGFVNCLHEPTHPPWFGLKPNWAVRKISFLLGNLRGHIVCPWPLGMSMHGCSHPPSLKICGIFSLREVGKENIVSL